MPTDNESRTPATFDIKALLAKEDTNFISLHELLTALSRAGNCSYQDAARLLLRRLQNTDSDYRPSWCRLDINRGIVVTANSWGSPHWKYLEQAADEGEPKVSDDDDIPF